MSGDTRSHSKSSSRVVEPNGSMASQPIIKRRLIDIVLNFSQSSYSGLMLFVLGSALPLLQTRLISMAFLFSALIGVLLLSYWRVHFRCLLFLLLGLLLATWRFQAHLDNTLLSHWERKDISVVAKVMAMPSTRGRDHTFRVQVLEQHTSDQLQHLVGSRLQLSCYRCPFEFGAGQVWNFTVRLKRPHGYASPGVFDYEKYLFRHQIVGKGYLRLKSLNQVIKPEHSGIDQWRAGIKQRLKAHFPKGSVALSVVTALSVGDKSGFNTQQRQVLQSTGLSHLFAISGLHVGLVFMVAVLIFKWLFNMFPRLFEYCPRPLLCLAPAMACAFVYSALAGFAVSTQRALLMLILYVLAQWLLRSVSLLKVLLLAAAIILLHDPFSILDAGFWLSCGAVFVIHLVSARHNDQRQPIANAGLLNGINPFSRNSASVNAGVSARLVPSEQSDSLSSGKQSVSLLKLQPAIWLGMI